MEDATSDQRIAVVFAGALSFGFYFFTFLICLRWLLYVDEGWKLRKTRIINWPIVVVTCLILVCNLAYLLETFVWSMIAARHAAKFPGVSLNKPAWTNILSCTAANVNMLLADIVLIVRCWIVYGRSRIVIIVFPSLMWIAALLCTILQIYLQIAQTHDPTIGPYSWASVIMTFGPGIVLIPFWISTVLLNAYASVVLILRIYRAAEYSKASTSTEYLYLFIYAVAESGVLYFSITIAHFLAWFGKSGFALDIIAVLNAPIVGIAFNWFLIRCSRQRASEVAKEAATNQDLSTMKFTEPHRSQSRKIVHPFNDSSSTDTDIIVISANRTTTTESSQSGTLISEGVDKAGQ